MNEDCKVIGVRSCEFLDIIIISKPKTDNPQRFFLLFLLLTLNSQLSTLNGAFKDTGWGVRPAGMGGAYTAISDDHNALFFNPAGTAQMETRELSLMFGRPFTGLNLRSGENDATYLQTGNISAVSPFPKIGSLGIGWTNFLVAGLYQEDTFIMNYANSLHDKLFSSSNNELYLGLNLKLLRRSFSVDDDTLSRERDSSGKLVDTSPFADVDSKSAYTFDFGILAKFYDAIAFGISGKNLDSPDVGFKSEDRAARELRTGVAFFAKDIGPFEDLTPSFDISYRKAGEQKADVRAHIGAETWFGLRSFGIRVGGNDREMTMGLTYVKTFPKFSFQIDYAFVGSLTLLSDNMGTHRISVVWKQFTAGVFQKKIQWKEKAVTSDQVPITSETPTPYSTPPADEAVEESELLEEALPPGEPAPAVSTGAVPLVPETGEAAAPALTESEKDQITEDFEKGKRFFAQRNYDTAKKAFEKVLQIEPLHKPSIDYLKKIDDILSNQAIKPLNINRASIRDFQKLGFTESDARRIIVQRIRKPFTEIEEIGMIQGINVKTYQKAKEKLFIK